MCSGMAKRREYLDRRCGNAPPAALRCARRVSHALTVLNGDGSGTETLFNKLSNSAATAVLANRTVSTTSVDGKSVTIQRDKTGVGWFDQVETRVQATDNSHTHTK